MVGVFNGFSVFFNFDSGPCSGKNDET